MKPNRHAHDYAWSFFVDATPTFAPYAPSGIAETPEEQDQLDAEQFDYYNGRARRIAKIKEERARKEAAEARRLEQAKKPVAPLCPGCGAVCDGHVIPVFGPGAVLLEVSCVNCGWEPQDMETFDEELLPARACRHCRKNISDGRIVWTWETRYDMKCASELGLSFNPWRF